jgi:hypothetical protein
MVASLIVIIAAADDFARNAGFVDAADRNYARANGYNKAGDWAPMRARLASEQKIAESRRQEEEARLARERQEEEARLAAEAAREREEAEKRTAAEKRAKQEQCAVDLKCTAEEAWAAATTECSPLVERMAKNDFQWTDRWYRRNSPILSGAIHFTEASLSLGTRSSIKTASARGLSISMSAILCSRRRA